MWLMLLLQLDKNERVWIRGQTGTFDPPPAPARFLQADPARRAGGTARAGNEDPKPQIRIFGG